jgi:hypothetical protein
MDVLYEQIVILMIIYLKIVINDSCKSTDDPFDMIYNK